MTRNPKKELGARGEVEGGAGIYVLMYAHTSLTVVSIFFCLYQLRRRREEVGCSNELENAHSFWRKPTGVGGEQRRREQDIPTATIRNPPHGRTKKIKTIK